MNELLITKEDILRELSNRGYKAKSKVFTKNGTDLEAIAISSISNIEAVFYTKDLLEDANEHNKSLDTVVEEIINGYKLNEAPPFDVNLLKSKEFILNNIYIGLAEKSAAETVTPVHKPLDGFDGINCYLYIRYEVENQYYTTKVPKSLLSTANVSEEDAWQAAMKNTIDDTLLYNFNEFMRNKFGMPSVGKLELPLYLLTNVSMYYGAGSLVNKEVLKGLCEKHNTKKILVLPSSIHEALVMPLTDDSESVEFFSNMVSTINHETVDPKDRLIDKAFVIEV